MIESETSAAPETDEKWSARLKPPHLNTLDAVGIAARFARDSYAILEGDATIREALGMIARMSDSEAQQVGPVLRQMAREELGFTERDALRTDDSDDR